VLSRDPLTTETEIIIDWTSLASPYDGYAPVIAYNLQWDKGTNGVSWYDLYGVVPTATLLSFTLTSDIVPGGEYEFRIRAGNVHGFGAFTAPFTIMAAGKPFQVSSPITSIDSATGKLKIEWTAPHDGSDLITSYLIEIADSTTTTWTPDATDCSGTNPAILSCLIPMSTLTSAPYNYLFDDLVKVRVTAINSYGSSPVSSPNSTGARIRRVPDKMGALTVVSKTENQVTLSWSALTGSQIGNSPLI